MIVAEQCMDFNPDSSPCRKAILSPKKEKNQVLKHEEYSLTSATSCVSEETLTLMSCQNEKVDISEIGDDDIDIDLRLTKVEEDPDATEYSSSFSDTSSDADMCNGGTEAEVVSYFSDNNNLGLTYNSIGNIFLIGKKRLTNHWKSFIRPLMWRCKWTELRIKDLDSRMLEYSRQLELYDQAKVQTVDSSMSESCGIKSVPFSNPCYRKMAARRRKRKKVENTNDITSYLNNHNLFSYIEKKRSSMDGIALAEDFCVLKEPYIESKCRMDHIGDEQLLVLDHREGDNVLEQILWNIEVAHSRIQQLKNQLDALTVRFSSSENLSLLAASSSHSPTISTGTGDLMSVKAIYNSKHMPDYEIRDLNFSESAMSSYREGFDVPDIIKSTVGLLSAADVSLHDTQIADSCENMSDNILIHNRAGEGPEPMFMETSCQLLSEQVNETEECEQAETSGPSQSPQIK